MWKVLAEFFNVVDNMNTSAVSFIKQQPDGKMITKILLHLLNSWIAKQLTSILHISHFLFSKINETTWFIICWFSLYVIAEKSVKIIFYEIKLGKKVEPHHIILPKYLHYYIWGTCNMDGSCFAIQIGRNPCLFFICKN